MWEIREYKLSFITLSAEGALAPSLRGLAKIYDF